MKGHVRKRGNKWSFVIDLGRDEMTGKRNQKWFSGYNTKKEAEKAMSEKLYEVNKGTYIEPSKETLEIFMLDWLKNKESNVRASTFNSYKVLVNHHIIPSIGKYQLSSLNAMHIQKFYNKLADSLSNSTILKIHKVLKMALEKAVHYGFLTKNVADIVDPPRVSKKEMNIWNGEQVRSFLDSIKDERLYIVFLLAITTGMRRGEILGLRWKDIDFEQGSLSIIQTLSNTGDRFQEAKTSTGQRSIALPDIAIEELKKHKKIIIAEKLAAGPLYEVNDLVVCTSLGTKLLPRNLGRVWYRLLEKSDLPKIRFHDLRHTHATLMLKQGVHPKIVQERLGHANIKVTLDTYSHVLPGLQEAAAKQFGENLFGNKNKQDAL